MAVPRANHLMQVWPVLLDATPPYLGRSATRVSLLRAPLGRSVLVGRLLEQIGRLTADAPTIIAPHGADESYRADLRAVCPGAVIATSARELADVLAHAETSDLLLFVDPRCLPIDASALTAMVESAAAQPQMAHHLVAYAADLAGTRESVNTDGDGHVRSVHRYYKLATWPFIAGVAASVVPVSSGLLPLPHLPDSLLELRQELVSLGVPSADVAIASGSFDLTTEQGMLAAVEQSVRDAIGAERDSHRDGALFVGEGHCVDPTARLLGPVVLQAGAQVGARATVVGPCLLGEGSRVGADAVVAHISLGARAVVLDGQVVRDRAWFAAADHVAAPDDAVALAPSFVERLARQGFEPGAQASTAALTEMPARLYPRVKRAFDAAIAALALVVLSPVLAIVAAVVWLNSRGPVFFLHAREGIDGQMFNCLKFRTMRVGANDLQRKLKQQSAVDGPHFKIASDPRITTVGRWLRATNLDELPQLFNVLRGEMSLVGPRPSPFRENQVCVPWRNGRLSVRPGITGLWQVCRHDRAAGDFHQWIEYDLLYVQHMTLWLDFKVLAATVFTLGGKFPVQVSRLLRLPVAALPPDGVGVSPDRTANPLAHERPARSTR